MTRRIICCGCSKAAASSLSVQTDSELRDSPPIAGGEVGQRVRPRRRRRSDAHAPRGHAASAQCRVWRQQHDGLWIGVLEGTAWGACAEADGARAHALRACSHGAGIGNEAADSEVRSEKVVSKHFTLSVTLQQRPVVTRISSEAATETKTLRVSPEKGFVASATHRQAHRRRR